MVNYEGFNRILYLLFVVIYRLLLSDTELTKYILQQIIRCNGAGYFAEVVEGLFDIHRQEIGSDGAIYTA